MVEFQKMNYILKILNLMLIKNKKKILNLKIQEKEYKDVLLYIFNNNYLVNSCSLSTIRNLNLVLQFFS